jgi:hypothetical protein
MAMQIQSMRDRCINKLVPFREQYQLMLDVQRSDRSCSCVLPA